MSDHQQDRIADYVEGRMTPEEATAFEEHLASNAELAADLRYAEALRQNAMEQGWMHVPPDRLVALAAGDEGPTSHEASHLGRCESCRIELEWAREREPSTSVSRRRIFRRWGVGSALLAAATLALFLVNHPRDASDPADAAALAQIEPIPVNITRSLASSGEFEEARLRGLEHYREGRFDEAATTLHAAVAIEADDPVAHLYLGSASLLLGRLDEAVVSLQHCREWAGDQALRAESIWQIAQVHLAAGRVPEAREALRELTESGGPRADAAARLLGEMER